MFLEKIRMQVDKNNLKKTNKVAYQSVCEVLDRCDVYAVYDNEMYTHREPSEYTRFMDMSLVLQDEAAYESCELVQAEKDTTKAVATSGASNATVASTTATTSTAIAVSPYEIENETVPKPLHIEPNPSDVAKALTWWGIRPDDALLQEIDRKRVIRAQEYHNKVRQAAEKAEQERLKMLEAQAKQKADDERRSKWLERANRKPTASTTATSASTAEHSKPSAAPPAPVRAAQPVRGPRDRDYSNSVVKPAAPPVPAPPTITAPPAPPALPLSLPLSLPVATGPVPPPPPVLSVPTAITSKVHKDRDYSSAKNVSSVEKSASVSASSTVKSTSVAAAATTTTATADDTTRTRRKSRDYSDEPSILPSTHTANPSVSTNATLKAPAASVAKDRHYAHSGSQDHRHISRDSKDTSAKNSSARLGDRNDSRHRDGRDGRDQDRNRDQGPGRADSRGNSRDLTKDPFGRDLNREVTKEPSREVNGESNREVGRSRGSKRSRSRSPPRSAHTTSNTNTNTNSNKPNPTHSNATKHNSNHDRTNDSFRSINTTSSTTTSKNTRDVSPVLSRALSTGRDGPRGGPSPPTVKSTVNTAHSTASGSGGSFRDSSSKSTVKDSRDDTSRDTSASVHVSSKVVVPNSTSSARSNITAAPSSASGASTGGTSGGQKRQRSPSPTPTSTSNKKDAYGRSVPSIKTSTNDKADISYGQKDKPLTPTSSYRERNVPRPQQGNSHHQQRDHNQRQGQGRSEDSSYTLNRSGAGNNFAKSQPSSRTVHVNDRNYSESGNRQYNNGNRDRSRQY